VLTRRIAALAAGVVLGAVALAGQAWAHVEVSAKPAQALATDSVISFSAEAESGSAGIASVRVVLPQGIAPADVSYVSGPAGWAFAATADGFTISGKALPVHADAAYKVKVKQLPDARSLAFKTLVNYSDGDVDRWIELASASNPNPEHPAPVLKLAAAVAAPSPTAVSLVSPAPSDSPSAQASSGTPEAAAPASSTMSAGSWIILALFVGAAAALGVVFTRRRTGRQPQ
jgi:uncharacterized protein YcnI